MTGPAQRPVRRHAAGVTLLYPAYMFGATDACELVYLCLAWLTTRRFNMSVSRRLHKVSVTVRKLQRCKGSRAPPNQKCEPTLTLLVRCSAFWPPDDSSAPA
jgi:hypothetical protein